MSLLIWVGLSVLSLEARAADDGSSPLLRNLGAAIWASSATHALTVTVPLALSARVGEDLATAAWVNLGVSGVLFLGGMTMFAAGQGGLDAEPVETPALRDLGIAGVVSGLVLIPVGSWIAFGLPDDGCGIQCLGESVPGFVMMGVGGAAPVVGMPLLAAGQARLSASPAGLALDGRF